MHIANSQEKHSQHDDDERDYVPFHGSRLDRPRCYAKSRRFRIPFCFLALKNVARELCEQSLDWRLLVGALWILLKLLAFQGNRRPLRDMRIVRWIKEVGSGRESSSLARNLIPKHAGHASKGLDRKRPARCVPVSNYGVGLPHTALNAIAISTKRRSIR